MVRATRDGVNVDKTLRVVVKNTGTPPPTNNAPEFANASYTFDDVAVADNTTVGTVAATDDDGDDLTYSLTGTDNARFAISSSGVITNAEALAYETDYSFNVVANDSTDTTSVGVTVSTPDLAATTLEIVSGDNQSAQVSTALANALIVQVNNQNGDAFSGETVTFSTTGGTLSETSVTTGANGQASTTLTLPSTAGDYTVTASVTGVPTDVSFTATATATPPPPPPNNAPEFANASYAYTDVALAVNTVVATITATDDDDDTLTYSLTGDDASTFDVDSGTGEITVATALTYSQVYSFNIEVTDDTDTDTATVSVTAVANTAPSFANATYTFDDVAIAANTVVGTITATDADSDTLSYSLTGTDASKFSVDSDGQITVSTALEKGQTYDFTIEADDGTDTDTATVEVNALTTAAGAPTIAVDSKTADSITIIITANSDDGGTDITDWEYELDDDGTWKSFGSTDLEQTIESLEAETEYDIKVRGVNAEDNGAESTAVTETTDAEPQTSVAVRFSDTYNEDLGYNVIPESLGALKRINANDTITSLGNLWYEQRPYNVAVGPALSFEDALHITMGYGNMRELLRLNSQASQADNAVHLVLGDQLHYVVPTFAPTGNIYSELADLAKKVNATLAFDNNIVSVMDRSPYRAEVDGATGTGTGDLDFDNENKAFPTSGYVLMGKEVLGYTGIGSGALTGVSRGLIGTAVENHANNTEIVYLDALIRHADIESFDPTTDTTRIYNVIRDPALNFEVRDEDSIEKWGERILELDLGLTRHEKAWAEKIFESYLQELRNVQYLLDVSVTAGKMTNSLDIGLVAGVRYGQLVYAARIVSIAFGEGTHRLQLRTV